VYLSGLGVWAIASNKRLQGATGFSISFSVVCVLKRDSSLFLRKSVANLFNLHKKRTKPSKVALQQPPRLIGAKVGKPEPRKWQVVPSNQLLSVNCAKI
jgi:hypothetical protein